MIKRPIAMNQPLIGKLIRELRLETEFTQEQFAPELDFTYSSINRVEARRTNYYFIPIIKPKNRLCCK